jgi:hypothetical protein
MHVAGFEARSVQQKLRRTLCLCTSQILADKKTSSVEPRISALFNFKASEDYKKAGHLEFLT